MKQLTPTTIRKEIEKRQDQILEWTKTLIRFQSENRPPEGMESKAQAFIKKECINLGLETEVFRPDEVEGITEHPSWLPGRTYPDDRVDVVAKWKGTGEGKSLLLSGHVDVAPFAPDNWQVTRPYKPLVKDGRL